MSSSSPTLPSDLGTRGSGSRRAFALHFLEMVLVMFVGMGVFSGLAALAFAAAGSSVSDQSGAFRVMLMGVNMTIPMVAWMAFRGHRAVLNVEMAAAMLVPTFLAAAAVWADALDTMAGLGIQHAVMVPAMLGVMLWRYDDYSHAHRASSA
jgi:hypothetical protein